MFFPKNRAPLACVPAAVFALVGGLSMGANAQTNTLETVVVTTTRTPVPQADVIGDVRVIDRETIEQSAGLTVSEILRQHGGVQITSNGGLGNSSSVFIRGTNATHVLLLIDGVRYGSATLGQPNWDNLPLAAIERIEVLRGPAASLYGSDAVGGVVQIFTKRGKAGEFSPYASTTVGSYGRVEVSAGVSGGSEQARFALGGSRLRESGFSATNPQVQFNNFNPDKDGFEQQSLNGQLQFQLASDLELSGNIMVASGENQFDSSLNGGPNFDARGLTTTRTMGLQLSKNWGEGHETRVAWGRADDLTRNIYRTATTVFDTEREIWSLQHNWGTSLGQLMLGADHSKDRISSTTPFDVKQRSIQGFFAGLQGRHEAHRWQANVRRDKNSQFGGSTTGSLGYGFEFVPNWSVFWSSANSFRSPSFNDLYWPNGGNPRLNPERGFANEIGLNFERESTQFKLTIFETRLTNMIAWAPIGPGGSWIPSNVDKARIAGQSFQMQTVYSDWKFGGHLELLDARNKTSGANFNKRLNRRADQQLTMSAERAVEQWWLGAHVLAVSRRYDDVANNRRLGGFGTLGLSAERPLGNDWRLNVRLNNVGNKTYETVYGYNQPGRSIYATLNWRPQR